MNKHIYYNPNPKGNKRAGDCVIRAICKATGMDWDDVYKGLCNLGFELKMPPTMDEVGEAFLAMEGFVKIPLKRVKGKLCPTVSTYQNDGVCILRVANHLVCMIDNEYFDTWNSGWKSVYAVYRRI